MDGLRMRWMIMAVCMRKRPCVKSKECKQSTNNNLVVRLVHIHIQPPVWGREARVSDTKEVGVELLVNRDANLDMGMHVIK